MTDEELRELFEKPKRDAVAVFKDNHDNGDTAIYQFISDIIPLLKTRGIAKEREILGLPQDGKWYDISLQAKAGERVLIANYQRRESDKEEKHNG